MTSTVEAIVERVSIDAPAAKIYEALTSPEGLRGWWSTNSDIRTRLGETSELRFDKDGRLVRMRFRIDELTEPARVVWTCVENDAPPWVGTTLSWDLRDLGDSTEVTVTHSGWKGSGPWSGEVAAGWKHFMGSLKAYVETGTGQPWG